MESRWAYSLLALVALMVASGCAAPSKPKSIQAPFVVEEFEPYLDVSRGTADITGQAFAKMLSGDVKYAAGEFVYLMPVTTYTTELWNRINLKGEHVGLQDPRLDTYIRKVRADGEGRFEFATIPPGEYYVETSVSWWAGQHEQFVLLGEKVRVIDGQKLNLVLPTIR